MQDYQPIDIRDSVILTNAFVIGNGPTDENVIGADSTTQLSMLKNQLMIYADFTIGNLTTCEIRIEFSFDNVNWYRETEDGTLAAAVVPETIFDRQLSATGLYRLALPVKDRFIRISAQGTGGAVTNSLLAIKAAIAVA